MEQAVGAGRVNDAVGGKEDDDHATERNQLSGPGAAACQREEREDRGHGGDDSEHDVDLVKHVPCGQVVGPHRPCLKRVLLDGGTKDAELPGRRSGAIQQLLGDLEQYQAPTG